VGATVLKNLDIDLRKVRLEVEKLVKCGPDLVTMGKLPQAPQAKKVIEYAIEESHHLGHNYVGTEHLLLGLLRVKDGIAARVLTNLWLKLEQVREEIRKLLSSGVESKGTTYEAIQAAACEALRAAAWPDLGAGVKFQGTSSADQEAVRLQRIIKFATEEAGKRNLSMPHSEHLLLALLREPEGVAARALANLGLSPDQIRQEIDRLTSPIEGTTGSGS
jgi:ATP-dependent Clp protease ATP-binding subunit ClpA